MKVKPQYVNPRNIFLHFLKVFAGYDIHVIADNINDDTYKFLCSHYNKDKIVRTFLSNSGAFLFAVNYAIKNFDASEYVYLAEDDYVYTKAAPRVIEEGLAIATYVSGYDHPDKYLNHNEGGPNPFISEGGELTRVLLTNSSHWKLTNSCCMTFAAKVQTLKEDLDIYVKYCSRSPPNDFGMFCELIQQRGRKLVSALPSVSTHGETQWLAKLVDWEKEVA